MLPNIKQTGCDLIRVSRRENDDHISWLAVRQKVSQYVIKVSNVLYGRLTHFLCKFAGRKARIRFSGGIDVCDNYLISLIKCFFECIN